MIQHGQKIKSDYKVGEWVKQKKDGQLVTLTINFEPDN